MNEGSQKATVYIYLVAAIAIVGIYWYYSRDNARKVEAALGDITNAAKPRSGMGGSNSNGATHPVEHGEGVSVLFPKPPPEGEGQ